MVCAEQTLSMAIESSCPMLLFDNLLQIKTITLAPKLFTWDHSLHVPGAEFVYRLCVHSLSPQEVHTSECQYTATSFIVMTTCILYVWLYSKFIS